MAFFSRTGNPEFSALTKVTGTLCASLHSVWRWAAPRRRAGLGTRGAGGLGSKGDEASGRREGARGQEAAL